MTPIFASAKPRVIPKHSEGGCTGLEYGTRREYGAIVGMMWVYYKGVYIIPRARSVS